MPPPRYAAGTPTAWRVDLIALTHTLAPELDRSGPLGSHPRVLSILRRLLIGPVDHQILHWRPSPIHLQPQLARDRGLDERNHQLSLAGRARLGHSLSAHGFPVLLDVEREIEAARQSGHIEQRNTA